MSTHAADRPGLSTTPVVRTPVLPGEVGDTARLLSAPALPAPFTATLPEPALRRGLEILLVLAMLLLVLPLMVVLAVLVASTSRGPVLFRHARIGAGGEPITVLKFRSMHVGAEARLPELYALNEGAGPLFKIRRDPRITPVGRWMRRLSLDELPQLFNVLGGSMSLVGPRPSSPEEVARFQPHEHRRHAVRPGLTGLAQINGRSDLAWEDTLRFDLHYVDHRTPALDASILLRTLPAIVRGRGAY